VAVRIGVVTFPGSLDDRDAARAVRLAGAEAVDLWHADHRLASVDAIVLPGGFSYGDYLRAGAIARFAPIMELVVAAARAGTPVLGICNGFQILCEAHLLPGALLPNAGRRFVCREQLLRIESCATAWTGGFRAGEEVVIPVKHADGRYHADPDTLDRLESQGRVVARYLGGTPNGSARDIAGICDGSGRVVGLMPHPEHAVDPLTGPSDAGLTLFRSVLDAVVGASGVPAGAGA
jgi:phosphoribosylformylglycinamidine synthase